MLPNKYLKRIVQIFENIDDEKKGCIFLLFFILDLDINNLKRHLNETINNIEIE